MELLRAKGYYEIQAVSGEVAFLWNRLGQLTLYSTRLELLQAQLKSAEFAVKQYVRNVKGRYDALDRVRELETLIATEREIPYSFDSTVTFKKEKNE